MASILQNTLPAIKGGIMRYSPIKILVALLVLGLSQSCQLISGISSPNTIENAQMTSYSFDQLVTSFMPSDGSILTLDGHMVITFTPIVTLLDHSSEGIKITKKSNGEEIPFRSGIDYREELGAYQMTIETLSLLEPYREYDLQMTSDFLFIADGIYQKLGEQKNTLSFRAAKAGALTISNRFLPVVSSIGDKFVVAGNNADRDPEELTPMIGIVGFDENSFKWKLEQLIQLENTTGEPTLVPGAINYKFNSIISIVVDKDSAIYALGHQKEEGGDEHSYYLHKLEYDGNALQFKKTLPVVGMDRSYAPWNDKGFVGLPNMRIFGDKLYIPMTVEMPNDLAGTKRNGAYILVADLDLNNEVEVKPVCGTHDGDNSCGIMDLQYCDGTYYAAAASYDTDNGYMSFIIPVEGPDNIGEPDLINNAVDLLRSKDHPSVINSLECLNDNIIATYLEEEVSLSVSSLSPDGMILWDLPMTWATFPIKINSRGLPTSIPFGLTTNGSDKIYVSAPIHRGTTLDVVDANDGTVINHFLEFSPLTFNYNLSYGDKVLATSMPNLAMINHDGKKTRIIFFDERGNTTE